MAAVQRQHKTFKAPGALIIELQFNLTVFVYVCECDVLRGKFPPTLALNHGCFVSWLSYQTDVNKHTLLNHKNKVQV